VRDAASDLGEQVLAWRDEINNGKLFGPTIFTAGLKLEGVNSIWKGDLEISNEEELNQMLDKLDKWHVDFVKITENTPQGATVPEKYTGGACPGLSCFGSCAHRSYH
jgi:hypothetical protein